MRTLVAALLVSTAAAVSAQAPLLPPVAHGAAVGVEVTRIGWDNGGAGEVRGAVAFLTAHVPISRRAAVVADLPLARISVGGDVFPSLCEINCPRVQQGGEAIVGNPFVGVRAAQAGHPFTGEVGVRWPTVVLGEHPPERLAVASGAALGRSEAFAARRAVVIGMGGLGHAFTPAFVVRARGGLSVEVGASVGAALVESELAWRSRTVRVAATSFARVALSDGTATFGERTAAYVGLDAMATLGRVRPGLRARLPLGQALPAPLGPAFGLTLSVALGGR